MRMIERSSIFKKDFKRIHANSRHKKDIEASAECNRSLNSGYGVAQQVERP